MSGWNHDRWDADRPAPQPWDPVYVDAEPRPDVVQATAAHDGQAVRGEVSS